MPFDWDEYLTLARSLEQQGDEAAYRSAVSRAYYAAFSRAKRLIDDGIVPRLQPPPDITGSHEVTWYCFLNHYNALHESIQDNGVTLKKKRTGADYYNQPNVRRQHAQLAISMAAQLIADLKALES